MEKTREDVPPLGPALLTPYAAQTLSDDALRAGWGLTLAADASAATLAWVRGQFPRLGDRGVELDVRRDSGWGCGAGALRSSRRPTRRREARPHIRAADRRTGGTPMLEEEDACRIDLNGGDEGSSQEA